MSRAVVDSELTGRKARVGPFDDQRRSTWDKLVRGDRRAGTRGGHGAGGVRARRGVPLHIRPAHRLEPTTLQGLLAERGMTEARAHRAHRTPGSPARLPGRRPYDPSAGWEALTEAVGRVTGPVGSEDSETAAAAVAPACEAWRTLHDRRDRLQLRVDEHLDRALRRGERPGEWELIGEEHSRSSSSSATRSAMPGPREAPMPLSSTRSRRCAHTSRRVRRDGSPDPDWSSMGTATSSSSIPAAREAALCAVTSSRTPRPASGSHTASGSSGARMNGPTAGPGCASTATTANSSTSNGPSTAAGMPFLVDRPADRRRWRRATTPPGAAGTRSTKAGVRSGRGLRALRPDSLRVLGRKKRKAPRGRGLSGSGAPAGAPRRGCRLPTCRSGHRR